MREDESVIRITIRLFEGDKEELNKFYPAKGYNWCIRHLVRRHIKALKEKENRKTLQTGDEIMLEEGDLS